MRPVTLLLVALLVLIQYPLWLGKGGWLRVRELDRQLQVQNRVNADLKTRYASLDAEVRDLKSGTGAIEERARYELGMVKEGELFVQIVDSPPQASAPAAPQR
jgi:cell division protein FtsB